MAKVLVDRAHERVVRFGDYVVIGVLGNGAAAGHGRQRRAPPPFYDAVHPVAMQVRRAAADAAGIAFGQRADYLVEFLTRELPVWIGAPGQRKQVILCPVFLSAGSHDLLRQHVQRP